MKKRQTKDEKVREEVQEGFAKARLYEIAALADLDAQLAQAMRDLLPAALKAAQRPKPDVRLLRLISRHASVAARKLRSGMKREDLELLTNTRWFPPSFDAPAKKS